MNSATLALLVSMATGLMAHFAELEQEAVDEFNAIAHGEGGMQKVKAALDGAKKIVTTLENVVSGS